MRISLAVLGAVFALSAGCGGEGGGSGGFIPSVAPGPDPVPEVLPATVQVPRAAAASGAVDLATQATTNVILDPFTHGEASGAGTPFLSPPEFEFSSHVEFEIDLDSVGKNGNDRFPNLSGILLVTVDGLLQGTWMAGEASYAVMIETGSEVVAVDPDSGVEAAIPQGATWNHSLAVTWEITDSQNWIVIATSTKAVEVEGIVVTDGDDVVSVSVSGGREVVTGFAKVDGEFFKERQISGSLTVTIDDGQNAVEVLIEFQNDGLILVTVGGEQFGPFTPQEFREFFQVLFA